MSHMSEAEYQNLKKTLEQARLLYQENTEELLSLGAALQQCSLHSNLQSEVAELGQELQKIQKEHQKNVNPSQYALLREIGQSLNVNATLKKESIKARAITRLRQTWGFLQSRSEVLWQYDHENEQKERQEQEYFRRENQFLRQEMKRLLNSLMDGISIPEALGQDLTQDMEEKVQGILRGLDQRTVPARTIAQELAALHSEARNNVLKRERLWDSAQNIQKTLGQIGVISQMEYNPSTKEIILQGEKITNGERIEFSLGSDRVRYDFHGYEGDSCLSEGAALLETLHSIYGIDIQDKILSEVNPDRIGRTAKANPFTPPPHKKQGGHDV